MLVLPTNFKISCEHFAEKLSLLRERPMLLRQLLLYFEMRHVDLTRQSLGVKSNAEHDWPFKTNEAVKGVDR
jgi:hypothetical protein